MSEALAQRGDRFSQLLARAVRDERHGTVLMTTSGLTRDEHEELAHLTPAAHAEFGVELAAAIAKLRQLLTAGDPFYVVAIVQDLNLFVPWGEYYEPTHEGLETGFSTRPAPARRSHSPKHETGPRPRPPFRMSSSAVVPVAAEAKKAASPRLPTGGHVCARNPLEAEWDLTHGPWVGGGDRRPGRVGRLPGTRRRVDAREDTPAPTPVNRRDRSMATNSGTSGPWVERASLPGGGVKVLPDIGKEPGT